MDEAPILLEKMRLSMEESPTLRNVNRYSSAELRFRDAGGYAAEAEARRIASGVGLAADRLDLPVAVLSGGERRRAELARILFGGVDLLLLDEPTNHLDSDAKARLMKFLAGYRGALMVVSHDLALLDRRSPAGLPLTDGRRPNSAATHRRTGRPRRRAGHRR